MPGASSHDACWLTESVSRATMNLKKGGFPLLSATPSEEKGEAKYCGPLFNTSIDRVKLEIRLIVSFYVNELPG